MQKTTFKKKPSNCPMCVSSRIAEYRYGLQPYTDEVKEGKVVLGGCFRTEDDPAWQCRDCHVDFFRDED